jgi:hypothetical protein
VNILPEDNIFFDELDKDQLCDLIRLLSANIKDDMKRGATREEIMSRADLCALSVKLAYRVITGRNLREDEREVGHR